MMASDKTSSRDDNGLDPDGVNFGFHVVALIDFLGQAQELMKWDSLPQTPAETEGLLSAIQDTYGKVMAWRERFGKYFEHWQIPAETPSWVTDPDPKDVETFEKSQECSLSFMHFADTLVVYSPITNFHGFPTVHGICSMIITSGVMMMAALAEKTVFRGAIEIGMAGRFPKADLYGPALAKAHYLESKIAEYPRIVIGSTLLQYLEASRQNPANDGPARANRDLAARCLNLLYPDTDGVWIVDYLNDQFSKMGRNDTTLEMLREQSFKFVEAELDRFRSEGNDKVTERYEHLVSYFRGHRFGSCKSS